MVALLNSTRDMRLQLSYILALICVSAIFATNGYDYLYAQSLNNLELVDCHANANNDELNFFASVVVNKLSLGTRNARVQFAVRRITEAGEVSAYTHTSDAQSVYANARLQFEAHAVLDGNVDGGEYTVECTVEHDGGNEVYNEGWIAQENSMMTSFQVTENPIIANIHVAQTRDLKKGDPNPTTLNVNFNTPKKIYAKFEIVVPSGWSVEYYNFGDCIGGSCESPEYDIEPGDQAKAIDATIAPNQSGEFEIGGRVLWNYEGEDSNVYNVSPVQVTVIDAMPSDRLVVEPTTVSSSESGSMNSLISEFWKHIIVGVLAALILAGVGWIGRHLCFRRKFKP